MRRFGLTAAVCSVILALSSACASLTPPERTHEQPEPLATLTALAAIQVETIPSEEATDRSDGLRQIWLSGPPSPANPDTPTRIFALIGKAVPRGKEPSPAVVLVHGGGGTAFAPWIRRWNAEGFTAIAIAVEGQTDERAAGNESGSKWVRHERGGPVRDGIYGDTDKPIQDQWMYHAVFATIQAHNYLRTLPDVDTDQIGLVGISWGGIIASTTLGYDYRFAFGIPIYGAGHLADIPNQYRRALKDNAVYHNVWEPSLWISSFPHPILWMNSREDTHFSLEASSRSGLSHGSKSSYAFIPGLKHGHAPAWKRPESYAFAKSVLAKNSDHYPQFIRISEIVERDEIEVKFNYAGSAEFIESANLSATRTPSTEFRKDWSSLPLDYEVSKNDMVHITLDCKALAQMKRGFVTLSINNGNETLRLASSPLFFPDRYCET